MSSSMKHVRHGLGCVRPYVYGDERTLELIVRAFGAEVLERSESGAGFHVEARIGDAVVVLEMGTFDESSNVTRNSIYVYVEDVDAAHARALAAGATSIGAPEDKPYQERGAGVRDSFGNTWWIATYGAWRPISRA